MIISVNPPGSDPPLNGLPCDEYSEWTEGEPLADIQHSRLGPERVKMLPIPPELAKYEIAALRRLLAVLRRRRQWTR